MKADLQNVATIVASRLQAIGRYRVILFILFLVGLYGYLVLQINAASNVQPSSSQQATARVSAHIDPSVVSQLQQLQDNSVSVNALFNQARSNPFQ